MAAFSPSIRRHHDLTPRQKPWVRWYRKNRAIFLSFLLVAIVTATGLGAWAWIKSQPLPAAGGYLDEGMIGAPQSLNPLFSSANPVDSQITPLLFRSLLKYDQNQQLVADLAKDWTVSADGREYTVTLGQHQWHDQTPLTTKDVDYTIKVAQNPHYTGNWRYSFTDVQTTIVSDKTIKFHLKQPSSVFIQSLTIAPLPAHLLANTPVKDLSSSPFNLNPVGTGPASFESLQKNDQQIESLTLSLDNSYLLDGIHFYFYSSQKDLLNDFKLGKVQAFGRLAGIPVDSHDIANAQQTNSPIEGQTYALYFNTQDTQLKNQKVRQALSQSIDVKAIMNQVMGDLWQPADNLYAKDSWAYYKNYQPLQYDLKQAKKTWSNLKDKDKPSQLQIIIPEKEIHSKTATKIAQAWKALGITTSIQEKSTSDIYKLLPQANGYQIILLGNIVKPDPDRYDYWHSTQTPPEGLNISRLNNKRVDKALEEGRTLLKQSERAIKYATVQNLLADEAAVVWLYQPYYVYTWSNKIHNVSLEKMWTENDRYQTLQDWYVSTKRQ